MSTSTSTVTEQVTKEADLLAKDVKHAADENVDTVDSNVRYMGKIQLSTSLNRN